MISSLTGEARRQAKNACGVIALRQQVRQRLTR